MVEKEKMLDAYEINPYTMMIMPIEDEFHTYSKVYEVQDEYLVARKPFEIVKEACEFFGSSYKGRRDGTKQLIGATHKAPIIVDPHTSIFLFPTTSPKHPQCIWISHEYVVTHRRGGSKSTYVTFINNDVHEIPISFTSFENQLSRTAQLRVKFLQNIKRMKTYQKQLQLNLRK